MTTKNLKDAEWHKRRIEKTLGSFAAEAKRLTPSSIKKIKLLQDCSRTLINEYTKLRKECDILEQVRKVEDALISSLNEGILVIDSNCKIILTNRKAREILDFSSKEKILNANYFEYITFCHSDKIPISWREDPICKAFVTETKHRVTLCDDIYCLKKDETMFPVTASISPFQVDESTKAIVMTFYDATREKQTADIQSDFVSVASHQLKTPLSISNIHTELLLREHPQDSENRSHLEEILFGNKKIEELINRFFIISKISSGSLSLFKQHHDVNRVLDDILREFSIEIQNKHLMLSKKYEPSVLGYIDWVVVRIALHNIVSNAIKYTPQDGSITIETKHEKDKIHICISDTGCGIPHTEKEHVFMKFYRGKPTTQHKVAGTGVGLYITKSIIEQCGGSIWFESEENKGTTFHVTLPTSCTQK